MRPSRVLGMVSAGQLGCGLAGLALAVARRHPYDILWFHGGRERVALDALAMGTALSAPGPMLLAQAAMTAALFALRDAPERASVVAGLGLLGAAMVPGYLGERHVRHRFTRAGWDPVESPIAFAGVGLAAAMAGVSLRLRRTWPGAVNRPGSAALAPAP